VNVVDVPEQMVLSPLIETDGVTVVFTIVVIAFDVAGLFVAPLWFDVIIHVTTSDEFKLALVYVELFVPTLAPFNCHWYDGFVPPFVAVAVNVTDVPAQIELSVSLELIETFAFVGRANWKE
jgi:hypothetical protein